MSQRYTITAISLHWLMAFAFFALFGLGFYMTGLPLSPTKLQVYSWHKWAGVSLFFLAVLRLLWRHLHRPPAFPSSMSAQARRLAQLGHGALYFFMFAIPLSGWLMSSAMGFQTVWFGIVPLPDLLPKDKTLANWFGSAHFYLNVAFIITIVGHIGAALKHQFIDKDNILGRIK
ncbi:cytochrome b [Paenalcaligenes hominis]|uniref:cytochrome b n=1 Tax=Paenalcaligenes hominis TaxID=643674 RepID=UPI0035260498